MVLGPALCWSDTKQISSTYTPTIVRTSGKIQVGYTNVVDSSSINSCGILYSKSQGATIDSTDASIVTFDRNSSGNWDSTKTCQILGLEQGKTYYFKSFISYGIGDVYNINYSSTERTYTVSSS